MDKKSPEVSRIKDKYYISAISSMIDPHRLILKEEDLFGVFDRFGDILPMGKNEQGLYYKGTRFLSFCEFRVSGLRPLFLSSGIDEEDILLTVDLTNPDLYSRGRLLIKKDMVHIMRSKILFEKKCLDYIRIRNFDMQAIELRLDFSVDADFKDIFEVRGMKRKKRGKLLSPEYKDSGMTLTYEGLDGVRRITSLRFSRSPDRVRDKTFSFKIKLDPGGREDILLTINCSMTDARQEEPGFDVTVRKSRQKLAGKIRNCTGIYTSNEQFNESLKRAISDINMMITKTEYGLYPYGGIPWFCTPFGRDGIITALESLWINPELARGVLLYLAARQAQDFDRKKAAEPGKILHEARDNEMAALQEVPFGLYYGSVDSTPLFLILAGAYWRRTGDTALISRIWNNIEAALLWLEKYGDVDGDGFLEYVPHKDGLRNQGWKDSHDSIFHQDGSLAEGPIALCEVQGYQYAAKNEVAMLAGLMGKDALAQRLQKEAGELKEKFNEVFWDEDIGSYVLALDGEKRPCRVVSSNAGQVLFTGIADPDKALKIAETLTSDAVFSGWGIRTIGANEALYNPMSYHNGSVWPHDNALIAYGLSSCGLSEHFIKVFSGIFDASLFMEFQRLPELFCGFQRRRGASPTLYPVACIPQTWAAGSLLLMLQASLRLGFESDKGRIIFRQPVLPEFLQQISLKNLTVTGKKSVDLLIRRYGEDVTIEVQRKPEDISVLIIK
ncbi:amylo-alpha-1,6-glucosidase [hydrothermal vent metagenome]|uniref:Amylo-alpha-1,6-glucosidase n=1 Tax=hydrothermal vent metagenome TaxID=652676 RepID=A0A3B1CUZ1_9ZZZZ